MTDPRSLEAPPAKLPVDDLMLRQPPPTIVRFRRGMIIGLAGVASAGLCGVTYWALRPSPASSAFQAEPAAPAVHASETILRAPGSYDRLPKLVVPPELAADPAKPDPSSPADGATGIPHDVAASDPAHAVRSAPLLVSLAQTNSMSAPGLSAPALGGATSSATGDENGREMSNTAPSFAEGRTEHAHHLVPAASQWLLSAGSVISASLITGIDSELPGEITAQVTDQVYDSIRGDVLLIPQGARLIGRSDNRTGYGQSRVQILWQRLILPDGSSMQLDDLPASDAAGYSGLTDKVDRHQAELLKGVALSSLINVGSQLSIGSGSGALARAFRQSVQGAGSDIASQFATRNLDRQPGIQVRPGWPVTIIVRQDLLLKPWTGR